MPTFVVMKPIEDIFNLHDAQPEPVAGSLLVARPTVGDPVFGRSVIVVVEHGEQGTMGLILNARTSLSLKDLLAGDLTQEPSRDADEAIAMSKLLDLCGGHTFYFGGPVKTDEMLIVHDVPPDLLPGSEPIGSSGLYLGCDLGALTHLVDWNPDVHLHVRFLVGYSGWESGQLAGELARHDWAVLDGCDASMMLYTPHDRLWAEAVKRFGDRYRLWLNWPAHPGMN